MRRRLWIPATLLLLVLAAVPQPAAAGERASVKPVKAAPGALAVFWEGLRHLPFLSSLRKLGAGMDPAGTPKPSNSPGGASMIELVRPDGHVFSTLDLNGYSRPPGSTQLFPHHIILTGWDDKGERTASVHYMIKDLQVNPTLDASRFTLSRDQASIVIDETNHTFLKHPLLKKE